MQISPPNDDNKFKALNRKTDPGKDPREVEETAPTERVKPTEERREFQPRSGKDRRESDRRRASQDVLLDTRSPQERRKGLRRSDDLEPSDEDKAAPVRKGIDVRT